MPTTPNPIPKCSNDLLTQDLFPPLPVGRERVGLSVLAEGRSSPNAESGQTTRSKPQAVQCAPKKTARTQNNHHVHDQKSRSQIAD